MLFPSVLALLSQRFAPATRGRAMGWYLAAGSLGYAIGLGASGPLTAWGGWRFSLLVAAFGTLAGTALAFALMRGVRDVHHEERERANARSRMKEVLRNRPARLVILAYTFHCWELLGMWAWLPAFLAVAAARGAALDISLVGLGALLAGLTHLTSMAGSILGGAGSDRWGRTAVMFAMGAASLVCSAAFGWLVAAPLWLLVVVAVAYNVTAIADSSVYSTALTEVVPPHALGSAYALRSVLGFGVGAVSPWIFRLVLDACRTAGWGEGVAWGLAWTSLALGALPGPLITLRLRSLPASAALARGRR